MKPSTQRKKKAATGEAEKPLLSITEQRLLQAIEAEKQSGNEAPRNKELAARLGVVPGTITAALKKLVAKGYVVPKLEIVGGQSNGT
ncbi:MAG TPA: winged helix-turn-helix transcriptional regulator [Candidatus Angelobacter sp.]|nr:winged helix-turn-helix transcriptional regulator [Candidatus Angelobacter sp.]